MLKNKEFKIIVNGSYGEQNFGDDALLAVIFDLLNSIYSESQFCFQCKDSKYLKNFLPQINILTKDSQDYSANIFLYGGGTQFFSFRKTKYKNLHDKIKIVFMLPLIVKRKILKLIRQEKNKKNKMRFKHIAALGIGIGPFAKQSDNLNLKSLFLKMNFIGVRDIKSYQLCQSNGLNKCKLYTDLCFYPKFVSKYVKVADVQISKHIIGIVVRDWNHDKKGDAYNKTIFSVAETLIDRGFDICFILFAGSNDSLWIQRIQTQGFRYLLWNPQSDTLELFINKLSKFSMFITARYHGAVFASLLRKPSVCIGIEQKLEQFAELLGDGGRLWKYPFKENECLKAVFSIVNNYNLATRSLNGFVIEQGILADTMVNDFIAFCKQNDS